MIQDLLGDVAALLPGHVVALLLRVEVGDLLDGVHALLHGAGGAGQVRGRGQHVETLNLRHVVTLRHCNKSGGNKCADEDNLISSHACLNSFLNVKALVGAFNKEMALVGSSPGTAKKVAVTSVVMKII